MGTSRIAAELANRIRVYSVVSTDSIREILRCALNPELSPSLNASTYLAGQSENYHDKSEEVRLEKIIRAYKTQARAVGVGVHGLIKRNIKENSSVILEGVHIIPEQVYFDIHEHVLQYFIDIPQEHIHKHRFESRASAAPERKLQQYLDNFTEIRWIQDYLRRKASEVGGVLTINNEGSLDASVDRIVQEYYRRFTI